MVQEELFSTPYGIRLDIPGVVKEIGQFMKADTQYSYKVIIGSDSLALRDNMADFVTAVVVHRVGNGGRYFFRRLEKGKVHTLRERIINEVLLSLKAAEQILEELKRTGTTNFDFELHVDIGENGETKAMLQEVVGMVRAYNFEAKTKPESFVATKVADRHV
jgi:uncharacterized protein